MKIGDVIASTRRKKRIDQKELAGELSISASYLSQIENNSKNPSPKLISEIADKLGLPVSALLFQVIQESDYSSEDDRQLFLKAKPLVDQMLSILLSETVDSKKA